MLLNEILGSSPLFRESRPVILALEEGTLVQANDTKLLSLEEVLHLIEVGGKPGRRDEGLDVSVSISLHLR